jgi:hypothetical protein
MKSFFTIFLCCTVSTLFAQTYSKAVPDSLILNFIHAQLNDTKYRKHVRREMQQLDLDNFYYKDQEHKEDLQWKNPEFIFRKLDRKVSTVDSFFTRDDIDFFRTQIKAIKRKRWKSPLPNTELVENVETDEKGRTEFVMHSYSLPLFSADFKRAIIIKAFYCGLVCGGGGFYIYERRDNGWVQIKTITEWAE